jgi:hypothetical protein
MLMFLTTDSQVTNLTHWFLLLIYSLGTDRRETTASKNLSIAERYAIA